jgi:DNA-binding transcriptional regulator GbsR (MarR family)
MDEASRRFIEQMGVMTEDEGFPRIAGRIFGYLLLAKNERSLDEIAEELGVSRASVSTDARRLSQMGLLERRSRPGDRRDYYMMAPSGVRRMIESRIQVIRRFHELLASAQSIPDIAPDVVSRIASWDEAHSLLLSAFTDVLERLNGERTPSASASSGS